MLKEQGKDFGSWQEKLRGLFADQPTMVKKAMAFASFKIQEFQLQGESALETETAFGEEELLGRNVKLLVKEVIDRNDLEIIDSERAKNSGVKNLEGSIDQVVPLKPLIIIDY